MQQFIRFNSFSFPYALLWALCLCAMACSRPNALNDFQVEPGLELLRVAGEPLIKDPVDIRFNELGDALVLEMPGYPFGEEQSRIVVLKDANGDGIYDDKQIFVENLQLATSFLPYANGVLVAAPPYLLHVRDEDRDYIPERVDTLMGGFSTGNLQHNYNGLTLGLDHWVYAANGGNDGAPYWWNEPDRPMPLRGQDFRFNLKTMAMERIGESSGGYGLAMDDFGRVFATHNLTHISHMVFKDRYRNGKPLLLTNELQNISDHDQAGLSRIYPIGEQESRVNHPEQSGFFSGACGILYYGGGALGPQYDQTVWMADVVLNLLHVDKIRPQGASFTASRLFQGRDVVASRDRAFRPVNLSVGPDGAIYVVDMYRTVIEHPEWIPDSIEETLDLQGGKDRGRIYRLGHKQIQNPFLPARFKERKGLLESLGDPNQWVRNTAHRLWMETEWSTADVRDLRSLLSEAVRLPQLHALYLLANKGQLVPTDFVALLGQGDALIQEAALILSEPFLEGNIPLTKAVMALLQHPEPRLRMQAALTLATLSEESKSYLALQKEILHALAAAAPMATDPWLVSALALAGQHGAPTLFSELAHLNDTPTDVLAALALQSVDTPSGLEGVLDGLAMAPLSPKEKKRILKHLNNAPYLAKGSNVEPYLKVLEAESDGQLVSELAALAKRFSLPPSPIFLAQSRKALRNVLDVKLPDSVRVQQLALLELLPYPEKTEVLFLALENTQPLQLQEGALRQLAVFPEKEIGQRVVALWNTLGPQTRRLASDLLLYIEVHHDALLTGLEKGTINIGEMNFDLERRRQLLWWTEDESTKRRAEALFSDAGVSNRQDAIAAMRPALALTGYKDQGAAIFESACANCHTYGAFGHDVGPPLTEIARKSKETLLHDILDPNAAADPKYINHRLETQNGLVHMGIVAAETDGTVTIKKMGGEVAVVQKSDIKSFRSLGTSLMMEGLEQGMTPQEMANLLAFLQGGSAP